MFYDWHKYLFIYFYRGCLFTLPEERSICISQKIEAGINMEEFLLTYEPDFGLKYFLHPF